MDGALKTTPIDTENADLKVILDRLSRNQESMARALETLIVMTQTQLGDPLAEARERARELHRMLSALERGFRTAIGVTPPPWNVYLRAAVAVLGEILPVLEKASAEPALCPDPVMPLTACTPTNPDTFFTLLREVVPYIGEPTALALRRAKVHGVPTFCGTARELGDLLEEHQFCRRLPTRELGRLLAILAGETEIVTREGRRWTVHFDRVPT